MNFITSPIHEKFVQFFHPRFQLNLTEKKEISAFIFVKEVVKSNIQLILINFTYYRSCLTYNSLDKPFFVSKPVFSMLMPYYLAPVSTIAKIVIRFDEAEKGNKKRGVSLTLQVTIAFYKIIHQ